MHCKMIGSWRGVWMRGRAAVGLFVCEEQGALSTVSPAFWLM